MEGFSVDSYNLVNSEGIINVNTDMLNAKALELKNICVDILLHIENIKDSVQNSKFYWCSSSATLLREFYLEDKDEIDRVVINLKKQIEKLEIISGNYKITENKNVQLSGVLPDSVLE